MSYSVTQSLDYAKELCSNLSSAMINSYSIGKREEADKYAIAAIILRGQIKALEFFQTNGTDTGLTDANLTNSIAVMREFGYGNMLNIDEFIAQSSSDADALGSGSSIIVVHSGSSTTLQPKTFSYIVLADGQTSFQVPFNISSIDPDSVMVTLNDADPIMGTDYTVVGSTFTWTGSYPLGIGWLIEIKYIG